MRGPRFGLGIDADEEELPGLVEREPEIPKHLKRTFREARKKKKKPCLACAGVRINPLAQTILAKKAAMRLADKARAKRDKARGLEVHIAVPLAGRAPDVEEITRHRPWKTAPYTEGRGSRSGPI